MPSSRIGEKARGEYTAAGAEYPEAVKRTEQAKLGKNNEWELDGGQDYCSGMQRFN